MKIKYIALCLLLALVSCQRDEEMEIGQVSIGNERLEASYSSVEISCSFQTNVTIKNVQAYLSTEADFSSAKSYSLSEKEKNTFGATIEGLKDASTYYVRYEVSNRWSSKMIDKVSEFKTIPYTIPTVQTSEVSDVTHNTAIVGGVITENGGQEITERGVVYSKSPNPSIENGTKVESLEKAESYACTLMDLEYVTTYYVRAYAINKKGVAYGEEISFKTNGTTASLDTLSISDVTATSAVISGALLNNGGEPITALGICYGVNQSPTLEDATVVSAELDDLKFSVLLNDLQKGTTYYVRAYVTNANGTVYSEQISFKTEATIATITTTQATNISYTSATVGGNVTSDGGASVTERGVCYSTSANPTISDTKIQCESGIGSFNCNLTGLQDSTTYYARAYVVNAKGTAYGEEVSFTTKAKTTATVTTTQATNISYTSATVGGNVTSDGGASVTERGVCYSTSANPTTSNTKVTSGTGTGSFTCNLTDLQDGTTYYARAYAVNAKGTAYGEEVSFTTHAKSTPIVTTDEATEISYTEALIVGHVTADGGISVTEKGICYSTSPTPTINDSKKTNGSGVGTITCVFTDLQDGTTYYARAYAINELGVGYGNEISFATMAYSVPELTIQQPTKYFVTSATIDCEVTFNGGLEVTSRGVCYGTNPNPTISNSKVANGSGMGVYSCELSNLTEATTYYVRAYATNSEGTAYSKEVSFTTRTRTYMDGYEYVDLGLSVKWATMNVGASKPEDYGDYFAWGETEPKEIYNWSTYKHCNGSETTLTKYNTQSSYGTVDNKTTLSAIDDAAIVNWSGSWRMPTIAELTELREQCTWTRTTQNGVNGYKVTSKSNDNSIFLPEAGYRVNSSLYYAGSRGFYWSSSLGTDCPYYAWLLDFDYGIMGSYSLYRHSGASVRPVCP